MRLNVRHRTLYFSHLFAQMFFQHGEEFMSYDGFGRVGLCLHQILEKEMYSCIIKMSVQHFLTRFHTRNITAFSNKAVLENYQKRERSTAGKTLKVYINHTTALSYSSRLKFCSPASVPCSTTSIVRRDHALKSRH